MGIGKTTVCQYLKKELFNSVFLDGDWCWDASPFQVTDETKSVVLDNITHVLNNFIRCSAYENIIFCWVMHQQTIIDSILEHLNLAEVQYYLFTLTASEQSLRRRLAKDISEGFRTQDILYYLIFSILFSSGSIVTAIVIKHASPPTTFETGSAMNTPSVPSLNT